MLVYHNTAICYSVPLVQFKEGYDLLAQKAMERKWVLFKYRPKLHMQAHLVSL